MRTVLYALLVGALSAFAFAPVGWWPLLPIAFGLLCEFIWRSKSLWRSLLVGWAFGLGQFIVGLNWIATAFTYQAAMPAWLGWIAVVLLSLYLALFPAAATALASRLGHGDRLRTGLLLSGFWAIAEWARGLVFTGFPWNPLGVLWLSTPAAETARVIGTYGLSAIFVLAAGAAGLVVRGRSRDAVLAAILPIAAVIYGMVFSPKAIATTAI